MFTVTHEGITAEVHAVNEASARAQLIHTYNQYGRALLLDEEAHPYIEADYSISNIRTTG